MKKIALNTILLIFCILINAQNKTDYWAVDTSSNFTSAHNPYTDAISMWILRQNFTLDAYQAFIGTEFDLSNPDFTNTNNTVEVYLPLFNKNEFSAMLGTGYTRNFFISSYDSLNKPIMGFSQLWLPIQYNTHKWKFTILYERLLAGKPNSLFDEVGNTQRIFLMTSHSFNLKWCLTIFGAYYEDNMEEEKNETLVPAFQLRYKPNKNITMATGAPLLFGIEWTVNPKFDIYFSQIMLDETNGFISYNLTKKIGLTLQYTSVQKGSDTYFYTESVSISGKNHQYNHLVQKQSNIALKLGLKTFDNVGIILSGGYKLGDKLNLYRNENHITKIDGKNNFFVGFNIQYFKYF